MTTAPERPPSDVQPDVIDAVCADPLFNLSKVYGQDEGAERLLHRAAGHQHASAPP